MHESPFIQIIRVGIILFALIVVPGIAVCWNFLPTNYSHSVFFDDKPEQPDNSEVPVLPQKIPMSSASENESGLTAELPVLPTDPFDSRYAGQPVHTVRHNGEIIKPAVGNSDDGSMEKSIPTAFMPAPAEWASAVASNVQLTDARNGEVRSKTVYFEQGAPESGSPPVVRPSVAGMDYPALEKELNVLGAKYYRLEKWGQQGDLYRFSCYVSPNPEVAYQKYFQAIDSDEIRVMQWVVNEIKQWKNGGQSAAGY